MTRDIGSDGLGKLGAELVILLGPSGIAQGPEMSPSFPGQDVIVPDFSKHLALQVKTPDGSNSLAMPRCSDGHDIRYLHLTAVVLSTTISRKKRVLGVRNMLTYTRRIAHASIPCTIRNVLLVCRFKGETVELQPYGFITVSRADGRSAI
jgi:hypothetical protein